MRRSTLSIAAAVIGGLMLAPTAGQAGSTWDDLRPQVFDARPIQPGDGMISLQAPARPENQSFVPIAMQADFRDGRTVKSVTFIVDENPVPVAAVFSIGEGRQKLKLATRMRLNRETDVRAVVETSDGQLYMAQRFVKFAGGQAACSAPPTGDAASIAASMGKMELALEEPATNATQLRPGATLTINHPNHSGMVLDQISLLYIPLRTVEEVEVRQGDDLVFSMQGSMTLSQDPQVTFDYRTNGADALHVHVTDTDGAAWDQDFAIGHGS